MSLAAALRLFDPPSVTPGCRERRTDARLTTLQSDDCSWLYTDREPSSPAPTTMSRP